MAVDGRTLRREENRAAVLVALGELYADGVYDPNVAEIAARAGLSPRSLFRYFDDVDDLNRAAIDHMIERARPLLDEPLPLDAPLAARIDAIVDLRLRLYDQIAPAARAVRIGAPRRRVLARQLRQARTFFRNQVASLFDVDDTTLLAIDALLQFETYDLLPRASAKDVLTDALTKLLETR